MTTPVAKEETLEEIADSIATRGLPFSAFRNEQEWKDTKAWVTSEILSALRNERERFRKLVTGKRDGETRRYAYGGYSRELWHLNSETLKTVCNELLKEIGE